MLMFCNLWIISSRSLNRSILTSTANLKMKPESVCAVAMRMTGRCWQPHWDLIATFGAKTKIFRNGSGGLDDQSDRDLPQITANGKGTRRGVNLSCSRGAWNQSFLARGQIPGLDHLSSKQTRSYVSL